MMELSFLLLVLAAIFFLAAAFNARSQVNLTALGLFLVVVFLLLRVWPAAAPLVR